MNKPLPNKLLVSVKRRHIDGGRRSSRCCCPIALAIQERFPGRRVIVQLDEIRIDGAIYPTPPLAASYMDTYDTAKRKVDVAPIKFRLSKTCPACPHRSHYGMCGESVPADKVNTYGMCRCCCSIPKKT